MHDTEIGPNAAKALAQGNIEVLDVSNNFLGDKGAVELSKSKSMKKLSLHTNGITEEGVKPFMDNDRLVTLILRAEDDETRGVGEANRIGQHVLNRVAFRTADNKQVEAINQPWVRN